MNNKLQIAVDGFSSCGKSTLAKDIAKTLGIIFVDSGAMYRAVSLYLLENKIDHRNEQEVARHLESIKIRFQRDEVIHTVLNDRIVDLDIRQKPVNDIVSPVATLGSVRHYLVAQQQRMSAQDHVIMDGRDIGTVVFPNAQVKFFVTAQIEVRVDRRFEELIRMGRPMSRQDVKKNLLERDHIDSTREINPLRQASDAIVIDNTSMDRAQQLNHALKIIAERTGWSV